MRIDQGDIAQLSDWQLKRMIVDVGALGEADGPGGPFYRRMCAALIRARKERRRLLLLAEAELTDDTDRGALVADDEDLS